MHLRAEFRAANVLLLAVRLQHGLVESSSARCSGRGGTFRELGVSLGFESGSVALCSLRGALRGTL